VRPSGFTDEKLFTAEYAENAEEGNLVSIGYLCDLSVLCGE
jgi:hypothetical protein